MKDQDFIFEMAVGCFEKAEAPEGQSRRIGGFVSSGKLDKDGERVIQKGLDFSPFLKSGWFNDNHSRKTTDILGYPDFAKLFEKGQKLPNGELSPHEGWWAEGYLLGTPDGMAIWNLAKALNGTERKLGFSVEGKIIGREDGGKTISKAEVRNVAITGCPVNDDTSLMCLANSLMVGQGSTDSTNPAPGNAAALRMESVEGNQPPMAIGGKPAKKKKKKKGLTKSEAEMLLMELDPRLSLDAARKIVSFAFNRREVMQ